MKCSTASHFECNERTGHVAQAITYKAILHRQAGKLAAEIIHELETLERTNIITIKDAPTSQVIKNFFSCITVTRISSQ